jgi:catechol 2,3-dioxygenase-like lactoylglutathione lyase family enzyme
MITQLGNVTVVIKDIARSRKFFRDKLGLRLSFYDKANEWLCFDAGRVAFSCKPPWNKKSKKLVGVKTGVSFYVDDIDETYRTLKKKGVKFTLKPRKEPWGGILANFEDPDGNKFFLLQMPADLGK